MMQRARGENRAPRRAPRAILASVESFTECTLAIVDALVALDMPRVSNLLQHAERLARARHAPATRAVQLVGLRVFIAETMLRAANEARTKEQRAKG